jgi:predicted RNase H-like HicB family nuclease
MSIKWSVIKARGQIARGVRPTYHVAPERDGRFWVLKVLELDCWSQAERLQDVEAMARDLVAVWLDVPPDSFDIVVGPVAEVQQG